MNFILFSILYSLDIDSQNWFSFEKNSTNTPFFIFAFTSWCPHCHDLVDPFRNLQKKYEKDNHIIAAALDCTFQMELCSNFNIKSFPSFIFYYKSKIKGFLQPQRNQKGLEFIAGKIINYHNHDIELINKLYTNNKIDINTPRFVCNINANETEKYSEVIDIINDAGLVINETFFFDPESHDLNVNYCEVYFSESQIKVMDPQVMSLSDFISDNKIGYFTKTWNFDQISNLKKFFVLVLPKNQESISPNLSKEFDDYFFYGSIDPLGIDQIKNMFNISFDIEKGNQSCIIIIRIKNQKKRKIRYQIIQQPDRDKIQSFLSKATIKGQIQWKEVDDKYAKMHFSKIDDINYNVKEKNFDFDRYKISILGALILLCACIIIGYFIINYIRNRTDNKDE